MSNNIKQITGAKLTTCEKFTVNSILVTAQLITATLDLQKRDGDKYCLINKEDECSANVPGYGSSKYSLNLQIACEDSALYNYWENCINNGKLAGYEIVKIDEFCNIYLRKLIHGYV